MDRGDLEMQPQNFEQPAPAKAKDDLYVIDDEI